MALTERPESLTIGIKLIPGIPEELLPENFNYKKRDMEQSKSLFYSFDWHHSDVYDLGFKLFTNEDYKFYGCKFIFLNYWDMVQFDLIIDVSRKLKGELDRTKAKQIATEVFTHIKPVIADSSRNINSHIIVKQNNKMYLITYYQEISDILYWEYKKLDNM